MVQNSSVVISKKCRQCIIQPFLHVNASRTKCDSTITSHYSGVISKNNGNAGHEYKLSIDYKRTMEKQRRYSEQAEIFFNILIREVLSQTQRPTHYEPAFLPLFATLHYYTTTLLTLLYTTNYYYIISLLLILLLLILIYTNI